jgi:hypothetical protein
MCAFTVALATFFILLLVSPMFRVALGLLTVVVLAALLWG